MFNAAVRFASPLLEGRLVKRYKRFLADVRLGDGRIVTAHCANPGSMKTCLQDNGRVWLSEALDPRRKLAFTWEIAEVNGVRIFVNPLAANKVVREALERHTIVELGDYHEIKSEVRFGDKTRFDFALQSSHSRTYLEVKNVTLGLGGGRAAFPDSVTARGTRHLRELVLAAKQGLQAVLLFCVSRSDARSAEAAIDIDPEYAHWLARASASGVMVLAYKCKVTTRGVWLDRSLPVHLPASGPSLA